MVNIQRIWLRFCFSHFPFAFLFSHRASATRKGSPQNFSEGCFPSQCLLFGLSRFLWHVPEHSIIIYSTPPLPTQGKNLHLNLKNSCFLMSANCSNNSLKMNDKTVQDTFYIFTFLSFFPQHDSVIIKVFSFAAAPAIIFFPNKQS